MATPQPLKQDGRSFVHNKNTMERHIIPMGSKILTLVKYTDQSKTSSPYWQAKCFVGGKTRQKTTKEEDLKKAITFAESWYHNLMGYEEKGLPIVNTPHRFTEVAKKVLARMKQRSGKSKHKNYHKDHSRIYMNYLYPHFKNVLVENITTPN